MNNIVDSPIWLRWFGCDMHQQPEAVTLLDLDDHLLCEIFKFMNVHDKVEHVQRACMRFRSVLQRPSTAEVWGSITVKLQPDTGADREPIGDLIMWLLERKTGISGLRLLTNRRSLDKPYDSERAAYEQFVLQALAAAMAGEDVPMVYAGGAGESHDLVMSAPLSLAHVDGPVAAALQQSLEALACRCSDFQSQHWEVLCSLNRVQHMALCLQAAAQQPAPPVSFTIHNMHLTNLSELVFLKCSVSLQPILEHLSALTRLTCLYLEQCPLGLTALSAGLPPLSSLVSLMFRACRLGMLPPLEQLCSLEELDLSHNNDLRGVQRGLHGLTSLARLRMQGCTPIDGSTLEALQQLPALREFDVSGHKWTPATATTFGRLQHTAYALCLNLVSK